MIEVSMQYTCDGCGKGDCFDDSHPDLTKKTARDFMRTKGWRSYGRLDYCKSCVGNGKARDRETNMADDKGPIDATDVKLNSYT